MHKAITVQTVFLCGPKMVGQTTIDHHNENIHLYIQESSNNHCSHPFYFICTSPFTSYLYAFFYQL